MDLERGAAQSEPVTFFTPAVGHNSSWLPQPVALQAELCAVTQPGQRLNYTPIRSSPSPCHCGQWRIREVDMRALAGLVLSSRGGLVCKW